MTPLLTHPVLLHFKEDLDKNPADFERTKRLYYVAALISGVVATAFFFIPIALQTMILPLWVTLGGSYTAVYAAQKCIEKSGAMIQNAQGAKKAATRLKEMQNTYQSYQDTCLSESEKIITSHCLFAKKEYVEAEERLQKLAQDTSLSSPESRFEEIIQLQHQALLLKIDVCFKAAIFKAVATDNLSCLIEKKDLLIISDQDPLKRNQIRGLKDILEEEFTLKKKFTEPLICFRNTFDSLFGSSANLTDDYPEILTYDEVKKMSPESLAGHIFTLMNEPLTLSI